MVKTRSLKKLLKKRNYLKKNNIKFYEPKKKSKLSKDHALPLINDAYNELSGYQNAGIFFYGFLTATKGVIFIRDFIKNRIDDIKIGRKYIYFKIKR